jgi:hypothetical protein
MNKLRLIAFTKTTTTNANRPWQCISVHSELRTKEYPKHSFKSSLNWLFWGICCAQFGEIWLAVLQSMSVYPIDFATCGYTLPPNSLFDILGKIDAKNISF